MELGSNGSLQVEHGSTTYFVSTLRLIFYHFEGVFSPSTRAMNEINDQFCLNSQTEQRGMRRHVSLVPDPSLATSSASRFSFDFRDADEELERIRWRVGAVSRSNNIPVELADVDGCSRNADNGGLMGGDACSVQSSWSSSKAYVHPGAWNSFVTSSAKGVGDTSAAQLRNLPPSVLDPIQERQTVEEDDRPRNETDAADFINWKVRLLCCTG